MTQPSLQPRNSLPGIVPHWPLSPVSIAIITVCTLIEATLVLADWGLIDIARLRYRAYEYGGFWPGLLTDWQPNYAGQKLLMFLTYGFLHSGPVHLAVNMIALASLGAIVADRIGEFRYAMLYVLSILGGAVAFGLLAPSLRPMVGASGAIFGLAGALVAWEITDSLRSGRTLWPAGRIAIWLVLLNAILWWAMQGQLAWQTHLGGFLTGMGVAFILRGRPEKAARRKHQM